MAMNRTEAARLLDQILAAAAALHNMTAIAQRLQQEPDPHLRTIASTTHRHARGMHVALSVAQQRLQQLTR